MKDAALGHCTEARQAVEDQRRGPASDRSANSSIDSFVKGCGVRQAVPALRRLHGSDEGALLGEPQPVLPPPEGRCRRSPPGRKAGADARARASTP
jgi:hypothetical protein